MYKRNKYGFALAAALILFVLIGFGVTKTPKISYPSFVSFSPDSNGTKAIRTLLEQKGKTVREWKQPWVRLPQQENQALVAIEPNEVQPNELKKLLQWVEKGNELLLFQREPQSFASFTFKSLDDSGQFITRTRIKPNSNQIVLLKDDQGILAARTPYGAGSITLFLTPEWLKNDQILTDTNFEKIWNSFLQLPNQVWIDEYHHGYRTEPSLWAVYPGWLLIIYVQLLLVLLLWLWWKGKRFGSIVTPREWVVRRGDETLLAVASWYQRSNNHQASLLNQERYLHQLLHERWGVRAQASTEEILTLAARKWMPRQVQQLQQLLQRLENNNTVHIYSTKQFVEDSHEIAEIVEAIEKG